MISLAGLRYCIAGAILATLLMMSMVSADSNVVACYYSSWAHYRKGLAQYTVDDIPTHLCTHLIYAFAVLDPKTFLLKSHDKWLDIDLKNFQKFVKLKKKNEKLKVLLGLGGWNDSRSTKYSRLVSDAAKRKAFTNHVIGFLQEYGFDGLDLDWEYPGYESRASDKEGFTAWLEDLRAGFDPKGLLLTSAVSAGKYNIDRGYDVPRVGQLLDLIFLMSYDFHGSWENRVAHHSPLHPEPGQNPEFCIDFAVNYWIQKGAPASKMVIGIPLYGRSWTLTNAKYNSPGSSASGPGLPGPHVKQSGNLAYFECCLLHKEGWDKITGVGGPYLTKGTQWVGYDDVDAVTEKAQYALDEGIAGVMVWDLPSDDFGNNCGFGENPLMTAIATKMGLLSTSSTQRTPLSTQRTPPSTQRIPPSTKRPSPPDSDEVEENLLGGKVEGGRRKFTTTTTRRPTTTTASREGKKKGTTTRLPYHWLAWPIFNQKGEEDSTSKPRPTPAFQTKPRPTPAFQTKPKPPQPFQTKPKPPQQETQNLIPSSKPFIIKPAIKPIIRAGRVSYNKEDLSPFWYSDCEAVGFSEDPTSCNRFYRCTNDIAYRFDCPAGLQYNHESNVCDWPANTNCNTP